MRNDDETHKLSRKWRLDFLLFVSDGAIGVTLVE